MKVSIKHLFSRIQMLASLEINSISGAIISQLQKSVDGNKEIQKVLVAFDVVDFHYFNTT